MGLEGLRWTGAETDSPVSGLSCASTFKALKQDKEGTQMCWQSTVRSEQAPWWGNWGGVREVSTGAGSRRALAPLTQDVYWLKRRRKYSIQFPRDFRVSGASFLQM